MTIFNTSDDLRDILGGFLKELSDQPSINESFKKSGLVIRFSYEQPELTITIDCRDNKINFLFNVEDPKPDIDMHMKAEIAHKFWLGKVNLMMAIARRQIIAKGQIPKVLKLLPVIKPAYKLYPEYLKNRGISVD